jgi:hypothetical protein
VPSSSLSDRHLAVGLAVEDEERAGHVADDGVEVVGGRKRPDLLDIACAEDPGIYFNLQVRPFFAYLLSVSLVLEHDTP